MRLLLLCCILSLGLCTTPTSDHLLTVLNSIHSSHIYQKLQWKEKVILVELVSAAEVDQITHYIDNIGMASILSLLDHVSRIDPNQAHRLEELLIKELNQESSPKPTAGLSSQKTSHGATTISSILTSKWVTVTRTMTATTLHST